MDNEKYWNKRAKTFNKLDWAKEPDYLDIFVKFCNFKKEDRVLDVGTGTGIVAHKVAPSVNQVIGIDISQQMLEHSNWKDNKYFVKQDICKRLFAYATFDKITARMVFHHVMYGLNLAVYNCYNMLKDGGTLIIAEGIPPLPELKDDFERILLLKEERLTFLLQDLEYLMFLAKFKNIRHQFYTIKNLSVKKWLDNSGAPAKNKKKIMDLHRNGSDLFKKAYNLRETKDDCIIDILHVMVKGTK